GRGPRARHLDGQGRARRRVAARPPRAAQGRARRRVRRGPRGNVRVTLATPRRSKANGRNGTKAGSGRRDPRGVVGEIADRRLAELEPALDAMSAAEIERGLEAAPAPRPFALRLAAPGLHLIAEIKRRSP